jgi:hypothetical protein
MGRAEALAAIAEEMAKAGMMERAKEVFDQALKVAEGIKGHGGGQGIGKGMREKGSLNKSGRWQEAVRDDGTGEGSL